LFYEKKRKFPQNPQFFLGMKIKPVHRFGDYVIKNMRPRCNTETADREKTGKINTRNRPEKKLFHAERIVRIGLTAEKIYMMVRTEKSRRYQHCQYHRTPVLKPQKVLED
jgi:hypothetical protein